MTDDRIARRWALVATSLGFGVVQLDVSVVNVAVQPIRADLHAAISGGQWVVNAYTVAFAAFILSAGALGDRTGSVLGVAVFGSFAAADVTRGLRWSVAASIGLALTAVALTAVALTAVAPARSAAPAGG